MQLPSLLHLPSSPCSQQTEPPWFRYAVSLECHYLALSPSSFSTTFDTTFSIRFSQLSFSILHSDPLSALGRAVPEASLTPFVPPTSLPYLFNITTRPIRHYGYLGLSAIPCNLKYPYPTSSTVLYVSYHIAFPTHAARLLRHVRLVKAH